jgi:hypothetical protein
MSNVYELIGLAGRGWKTEAEALAERKGAQPAPYVDHYTKADALIEKLRRIAAVRGSNEAEMFRIIAILEEAVGKVVRS